MTATIPAELAPSDEATVDDLWARTPRRPKMKVVAALAPGAPVLNTTCRVCTARIGIGITDPRLCPVCVSDLPGVRAHAESMHASVMAAGTAHDDAWFSAQAALPDDLASRWQAACDKRTAAETALAKATNGRLWGHKTTAERVEAERQARAEVERLRGVWSRTAENAANPLCQVVRAEVAYISERTRLRDELQRWVLALQEIEAAEPEGLPF